MPPLDDRGSDNKERRLRLAHVLILMAPFAILLGTVGLFTGAGKAAYVRYSRLIPIVCLLAGPTSLIAGIALLKIHSHRRSASHE